MEPISSKSNALKKLLRAMVNGFFKEFLHLKNRLIAKKYRDSAPHFAVRFAAKEAAVKALGTGINKGVSWLDIEILNDPKGRPLLSLSENLKDLAGEATFHLSLSHCRDYATAFVVFES